MQSYGIKEILLSNNIIDIQNNIINEQKLSNFLFGLLIYYLGYERYKWFFNKTVSSQLSSFAKNKKVQFSPPSCPFRFIGIDGKTIFIGSMGQAHLFFKETLEMYFPNSYPQISFLQSSFEESTIPSWKKHECSGFCEKCKPDFSSFAFNNLEKICKAMGINSYLILDVPPQLFEGLISSDEFIEVGQDSELCKCNERLYKAWKYCPYCSTIIDKKIFNKRNAHGNPEKIFNEALSIYLALKRGYTPNSNHELDDIFNEELDVFLSKGSCIKIIEGTLKMDLDKDYVAGKAKTLVLIESQLDVEAKKQKKIKPHCEVIIWGINNPKNLSELEKIPSKLFGEEKKITIIPSGFSLEENNRLDLKQIDLDNIKKGFKNILDGILVKI